MIKQFIGIKVPTPTELNAGHMCGVKMGVDTNGATIKMIRQNSKHEITHGIQ